MALEVGSKAPAFSLYNTDRKLISLSDFQGTVVVLHFFPAAFTRVCTAQMCTSRDELVIYNELGATVFGVSTDMPFSLKVFKEMHQIGFDLLSDANKQVIHDYEMYHCNFLCDIRGVAKRGVIVIDATGTIAYVEITPATSIQVNFESLKTALASLK
jgi:peroxiredoxin